MTTVTSMKCACDTCLCIVSLEDAIAKNTNFIDIGARRIVRL